MSKVKFIVDKDDTLLKAIEKMNKDLKVVTEKALKASKQYVTQKLIQDTVKPNYPHEGKYSGGDFAKSIDRNYIVNWQGTTADINVGYDFNKSGMLSIYLLNGVKARGIKPANKLHDDIYSPRTHKKILEIQEETILKILQR